MVQLYPARCTVPIVIHPLYCSHCSEPRVLSVLNSYIDGAISDKISYPLMYCAVCNARLPHDDWTTSTCLSLNTAILLSINCINY